MTQRRSTRLPDEMDSQVSDYLNQHELTDAEAGRIAYQRLLKNPPTKTERDAVKTKRGNPNFVKK